MEREISKLAALMAHDDEQAFRQFFDLLYSRLYRYAFRFIGSDVLCEELVSDVFMKLWNNRKKLPKIEHLQFYIYRSVKNQVYTYMRRNMKGTVELDDSTESHLVEYRTPDNLMVTGELVQLVERAVSDLPARCQVVFRLVREDGLSYKEVAGLLEISPKTVENQMGIAIKKLKAAVEQFYGSGAKDGDSLVALLLIAFVSG